MIGWIDIVVSLLEVAGFSLHDFGGFAERTSHGLDHRPYRGPMKVRSSVAHRCCSDMPDKKAERLAMED
jgi:hypothetical protein